jgi:hypothetical protein
MQLLRKHELDVMLRGVLLREDARSSGFRSRRRQINSAKPSKIAKISFRKEDMAFCEGVALFGVLSVSPKVVISERVRGVVQIRRTFSDLDFNSSFSNFSQTSHNHDLFSEYISYLTANTMNRPPGFYTCPSCGMPQAPANFSADLRCRAQLFGYHQVPREREMPHYFQQPVHNELVVANERPRHGRYYPAPERWATPVEPPQRPPPLPAMRYAVPRPGPAPQSGFNYPAHYRAPPAPLRPQSPPQRNIWRPAYFSPAEPTTRSVPAAPVVRPPVFPALFPAPVPMHRQTGFVEDLQPWDLEEEPEALGNEVTAPLEETAVDEELEDEEGLSDWGGDLEDDARPQRPLLSSTRHPREGVIYVDSEGQEYSIELLRTYGARCKRCQKLGHTTRPHRRWEKISPVASPAPSL